MSISAKVLFDYEAEQDDELTLAVGDIITNVIQEDGGWWRGDLKGRSGVFPENFVTINGEVPAPASTIGGSFKALVKYDYEQEQPDELTLKEGDIINDIEIVDDGWWKGTCKGKNGLFPSNFVEKINDDVNTKPVVAPEPESRHGMPSDAPAGVMASLFSGMKPSDARNRLKKVAKPGHDEPPPPPSQDLKPTQMVPPMVPPGSSDHEDARKKVPVIPPPVTDVRSTNQPSKPVQKAKVLFDYEPEQSDELKLHVGTIITVIESELTFDGWMKGEVDGVVGVFPDNFVELLPPEPSSLAPNTGPPGVVLSTGMPPAGLQPPPGSPGQGEMTVKEEPISTTRPHQGPSPSSNSLGAGNPLQSELAKKLSARSTAINNQMSQSSLANHPQPPTPNQATKAASKPPPPPLPGSKPSLPGTKPKPGAPHGKPIKPPFMKPQETTSKTDPPAVDEAGKKQPQVNESTDPSVIVGTLLTTPEATGASDNDSNLTAPSMEPTSTPPVPVTNGEVNVEVGDGSYMSLKSGPSKLPLTATPSLSDTVKPTEPLKHLERAKPPGKSPPSKFKDKSSASSPLSSPPTSSAPNKEIEDLKQQVDQLQSKMTEMEGKFKRLLTKVTDELGEERKLRLSQQVEIDSLKMKLHVMNG